MCYKEETTSFQTSSFHSIPVLFSNLFMKAASMNKEFAESPATLFVAHFFGIQLVIF